METAWRGSAMASRRLQVMCINKRGSHYNPHERIEAIGGIENGVRWRHLEDDAIRNIERDLIDYFVNVNNRPVKVIVAVHNGRSTSRLRRTAMLRTIC